MNCALLTAMAGILACQPASPNASPNQNPNAGFKVEEVLTGLDTPWEIEFARNGDMYYTERTGQLSVLRKDEKAPTLVASVADSTETGGEGGLMGLALHPRFDENRYVYLSYTSRGGDGYRVNVARYKITDTGLAEKKVILDGIEGGPNHDGCPLAFGPDGKLYISTGERYKRELAQKLDSLNGKILRLNDDGTVPVDNPFIETDGARPEIWSYGHRNGQGFDWQPGTGLLWEAEHGPSGADGPGGGDEINIVERGKNYGWPVISHEKTQDGMEKGVRVYTPAVAPAGAAFYTGNSIENWKNDFIFACLRGNGLIRLDLEGREIKGEEHFMQSYGRMRAVQMGPDGNLYVSTSNKDGRGSPKSGDDKILRLVPTS